MNHRINILLSVFVFVSCVSGNDKNSMGAIKTSLSKIDLQDKIKGGWAGQVIGCTFGGPTEFQFKGSIINDYQPIPWDENRCLWYFQNFPELYDDLYMDLTFVDIYDKEGWDAPASSYALAFANAGYNLWHANQAARNNILSGILPPESGHWLNNPHSEDIDFQIESDFIGLMSPGMVNRATEFSDKIGHILVYGDGWYGGVFVSAMYSLAFVSNDLNYIVSEALKSIPIGSDFHQCINDVISWHKQFPNDWKQTWFETQKKWSSDIGCPKGVFADFDIDAKINAAYIVIGLLYGDGDFTKTLEISTRSGLDSDCNPSNAAGILGTVLGYTRIPEFWKRPIYKIEDMNFKYTNISLNEVYKLGFKHALQNLEKKGAIINKDIITISLDKIKPVRLERGFEGHYPKDKTIFNAKLTVENPDTSFTFKGNGFVITGALNNLNRKSNENFDFELEMIIDEDSAKFTMPSGYWNRSQEIAWKYQLSDKEHQVKIKLLNPRIDYEINSTGLIVYTSQKIENAWQTGKLQAIKVWEDSSGL